MARVYADARNGVLEPSQATRLTYILTCLQKVLEVESIELRLDALEQKAESTGIRSAYDGIKGR